MTEGDVITYANPGFATLVGPEAPTDRPLRLFDVIHGDDAARVREGISNLADKPATHIECRIGSPDGADRMLEVSAIAIDIEGRPAVLWFGRDVTNRKQIESQILQADRLAVLGTLAAGMAHAINNPLSYTLLNLEHVARRMREFSGETDYYAEARVRLAEAHDGADRVAKIVRQMRGLSRARPSAPARIDVRSVIENVLAVIGNEVRYRGQLVTRYEPTPRVHASESELEQAFLGLLLYVARLRPDESGFGREIRLSVHHDGQSVVVTISDDGPPLDPAVRARLFDPFSTGKGTGLGLAMCHAIFASLDGQLVVTSGATSGTTFRATLPAAAPQADDDPRPPPTSRVTIPPETPSSRARVLVIDDDPGVASALQAMLEANHEVTSVASAREGLRLLLGDLRFDVVFCDLVMPEISGIDLYCALELNRPETLPRIVFMTGGVFTPDAERFLSGLPNPRIEKPFSLARVEQLLAQAVNRRTTKD
jgi:PAS domain S-box-containing protein